MALEEIQKIKQGAITEDFNTMRSMLSEIELKILGVDLDKQQVFIQALKNFICEAWQDACNQDDTFLFPKQTP